jgi:DNA repair protein RecO (recombination protein O)
MEPTPAILLRKIPLSETSVIAVWLTRDHGLVRTAARGARKPGSPFAGKLDLFYQAEISLVHAKRGDLHTLREVQLQETSAALRLDYRKVQLAAYFVELLEIVLEPEHPEPDLYELLQRALKYLETHPANRRAMSHFERELARLLGHGDPGTLEDSLRQGNARPALSALQNVYHRLPKEHRELWHALDAG